jgi:hypothetical protein
VAAPEPTAIIRAAIAALQAGYPAKVAAFNSDPANLVDIDTPQTFHFGGQDMLVSFPFPQVEVAVIDGSIGPFAQENTDSDHYPQANVVIWLEGKSGEIPTLLEQAYGLGFAAKDILVVPRAFGDGVEIQNRAGAVYWMQDVIPADPTDDELRSGRFKRWRTPFFLRFQLDLVDQLG